MTPLAAYFLGVASVPVAVGFGIALAEVPRAVLRPGFKKGRMYE